MRSKTPKEEKHLRVTEMLYPFSKMQFIDEIVLENAAARGTRVHAICEGIITGVGEWDVEPALQGYVDSFKLWWELGHKVVEIEKRFYCDELMITGQVDLLLQEDNELVVCDLKTSAQPSKTWPVQGSAYAYLAKASKIKFIKLDRNGKPPKIYDYPVDIPFVKKCLEVYKYFF